MTRSCPRERRQIRLVEYRQERRGPPPCEPGKTWLATVSLRTANGPDKGKTKRKVTLHYVVLTAEPRTKQIGH
jgi:hypothetical protein